MSRFLSFSWAGVLSTSLAFNLTLASCQPLPGNSTAVSGASGSGITALQTSSALAAEGSLTREALGRYRMALQVRLPGSDGFGLKALRCADITKIRASVQGLGMATPVYAEGADVDEHTVDHDGSCLVTLNFNALPVGPVRLLQIEGLNNEDELVPGSTLKRAFAILSENDHVLRANLGHWPLGEMVDALLKENTIASDDLAARLDLGALQTFIESITDPVQAFNNQWQQQSFGTNPSRINTTALLNALRAANGNVDALDSENADFVQEAAEVSLNLQGLVSSQRNARISVSDPSSAARIVTVNGATSVTAVTPGDWLLSIRVPGYETHTQSVSLEAGQNLSLGTITLQEKAWNVTNFAGTGVEGFLDHATSANSAQFDFTGNGSPRNPFQLAIDDDDNLYIPDTGNNRIRRVPASGQGVSTLAGTADAGIADGAAGVGTLNNPMGAFFADGNLFVTQAHAVRQIDPDSGEIMATLAGTETASDPFFNPVGMAMHANGTDLYLVNSSLHRIDILDTDDNSVTTAAGFLPVPGDFGRGYVNGPPTQDQSDSARFESPQSIAWGPNGNLYIVDTQNHAIRRYLPNAGDGFVETFAGATVRESGYVDGVGTTARFNEPASLAFDSKGDLYVSDTGNHCIRKIVIATRQVSTFAGTCGQFGDTPGNALTTARFTFPAGLVFDSQDRLYVADRGTHRVYRIAPPATY